MAVMSYDEWSQFMPGGGTQAEYETYVTGSGESVSGGGSGATDGSKTLNLGTSQPYQRPAGIPAYSGYQAPNYGNTTPNSTHWLNTMNAYAPNARNDMSRLLGQGGSSGGTAGGGMTRTPFPMTGNRPNTGWQTGNTQGDYTPSLLTPEQQGSNLYQAPTPYGSTGLLGGPTTQQPATQNQGTPFPTQWAREDGYMDAFWNTPGGYAPPTQQQTTQNSYSQPSAYNNTSGNSAQGTVGIDPATGGFVFL